VTSITNRLGHSEQYEYGPTELLAGILDGNGNRITFHYTEWDRPSRILFPDGSQEHYDFNPAGRVEDIRSGPQHVVQIAYDDSGRPVNFRYGDGRVRELAYDGKGRLTRAVNQDVAAAFAYDDAGRLAVENQGGQKIRYEYDPVGNLVAMTYPGGDTVRFAYDADRRLSGVTDWNDQTHRFAYKPGDAGHVARIPGNVSVDVTKSPAGLPTSCVATQPGQVMPVFSQDWRYDVENRLVSFTDMELGTRDYRYDAEGQVLESTRLGPAPPESFGYDPAGNRVACNDVAATFNALNQLTAQGPMAPQYDERGNMTRFPAPDGSWHLTYDLQNQLVAAAGPGGEHLAFAYDALGRRILKRFKGSDAAVCETRYAWAGEQMITAVEAVDGRTRTHEYLYLPGSYTPLATRVDGVVYSYHCDPLGRPTQLTDGAGRVVWSAVYGAFGELYAVVTEIPNPLRAPGQYHDAEIGLYYNRFRYYAPHLGRYLSRDPVGLLQGANLYAYVGNNPVNRADPLGLWWEAALSIAAGVVVAAAVVMTAPVSLPLLAGAAALGVGVGLGFNKALNLKKFCLSCFVGAFVEGFAIGAVLTLLAMLAGTAIAVTGAVVGIGLMLNEHFGLVDLGWLGGAKSFDEMTPEEQSQSLGGLLGGLLGSFAVSRVATALRRWQQSPGRLHEINEGSRSRQPLSEQELTAARQYAEQLGIEPEKIVTDQSDTSTSWGQVFGEERLYIGEDLKPTLANGESLSANARVSERGAIAHELVGHREAYLAGKSLTPSEYAEWVNLPPEQQLRLMNLEEAQASLRAAKLAPGLTNQERMILFKDAMERLAKIGLTIDDVPGLGFYLDARTPNLP
jgi:RHS repeat-associated protein